MNGPQPPAGWYADGELQGQERYWDGQQWTDQRRSAAGSQPPPPPGSDHITEAPADKPEPTRGQKIGCGVVLAIALLFLLALCTGGDEEEPAGTADDAAPSASETPAASETPEPSPTPETPQAQMTAALEEAGVDVARVSVDRDNRTAVVRFAMSDNLSNNMIQTGAKQDTMSVIAAAQDVKPSLRRLQVLGTFPMQDKFGKDLGAVQVMRATYEKNDLDNIQTDNVTIQDSIWDLASGGQYLHPAFD